MQKEIKIGILGLGTVGRGVVRILRENGAEISRRVGRKLSPASVLVRDPARERGIEMDSGLITTDPADILNNKDISIVVELMGGRDPALEYILRAVRNRKHVVTANKEIMACHGREVLDRAAANGVAVSFEGSVAGGIPIVNNLKKALVANRICSLTGIINGTTNYILTAMEAKKQTFSTALAEAQNKGYAESDPESDIQGWDAAYKLCIMASIAFESRVDVDDIYTEGIEGLERPDIEYAERFGYRIKLLAVAREEQGQIEARVHPALLPTSHPLAAVNGVNNAILVKGNAVGEVMVYGAGAGEMPTGSAVVADIMNIAREMESGGSVGSSCTCVESKPVKPMDATEGRYYLRLRVLDRPGMIASIAKLFGDNMVSLASILQMEEETEIVDVVFITHRTREKIMQKTLREITDIDGVKAVKTMIRVESE